MYRRQLKERIEMLEDRGVKRLTARVLAQALYPEPHLASRYLRMERLAPEEDVFVYPSGVVVRGSTQEIIHRGGRDLFRLVARWVD